MQVKLEDQIISEFLQSIGEWSKYVIIGGGYALIIYKLYLADSELKNPPIGTRDIDSLLPRKMPDVSQKNISKHLNEAGFTQVFKDLNQLPTEAYTKEIKGLEVEIEFLTDAATRQDKHKNIMIAGVVAQPLSYLTLSLYTTVQFQTYSGQIGIVVSPGAWMFHKGLTFPRRINPLKIYKDLYGVWYVATQLGEFSDEAVEELQFLGERYPKWFKTFKDNLGKWIKNATPLDWGKLESQDLSGILKRVNFEKIIEDLIGSC